jgi:hypothetical protein
MHELAQAWCRMWNDEASLAHQLVTDDFRMWLGLSANGDAVSGPDGLARLVERYQHDQGVRFTPRLIVDGGEAAGGGRLAYSWDAHFPDGSVRSGIDVYTLRNGCVAENWSIVGERPNTLPADSAGQTSADPTSASQEGADQNTADQGNAGVTTSPAEVAALCRDWSPMWNGQVGLAASIVSGDFRIWFGAARSAADDLVGPQALADYVRRHRDGRDGLRFAPHRDPVLDTQRQRAAFTWSARLPEPGGAERRVGGIDLFQMAGGRLSRAWSITGSRALTF